MRPLRLVVLLVLVALTHVPPLSPPAAATDVYRWVDADGGVHFGNRPPEGAELMFRTRTPPAPAADTERRSVQVSRVIDGDTVQLTTGHKVRFAGINAPEVAVAGKPGQSGGEGAKARLIELVQGKNVELEYAQVRVDRYGRMLGYLFDADGDVAERLLEEGLAFVSVVPPNIAHVDAYLAAERRARDAAKGIWAEPDFRVFDPAELADARNRFRLVRMHVSGLGEDRGEVVLSDPDGFTARIPLEDAGGFGTLTRLLSRTVVVRGFIHRRGNQSYVALVHPSQIEADATSDPGGPGPDTPEPGIAAPDGR